MDHAIYTLAIRDLRTLIQYNVIQVDGEDAEDAARRFVRQLPLDQRRFYAIILVKVPSGVLQA